jgi:hypothetical protein
MVSGRNKIGAALGNADAGKHENLGDEAGAGTLFTRGCEQLNSTQSASPI